MSTQIPQLAPLRRATESGEHSSGETGIETGAIRVLHVDDDPGITELTQSFLERTPVEFVVESETDPRKAIERIRSGASGLDCIVSDYRMPKTDGLELLEVVREHEPDLPFILFTGKGSEEIAADAIASGVTDYLQKGGTEAYSILSNRIENAVESYRRQRELDRVHEQYQTLIENGSDTVFVHTADGTLQYVSPAIERTLGFDPDDLLGECVFELLHPEDRDRVRAQFSELRSEADVTDRTVQCRCRNDDGEWRWVEAVMSDERASSLEGFVVTAREVTERVKRERELKRQNDLFEATQELASVGGWEYDARAETLYWTDEVRRIHGLSPGYDPTLEEAIEFYHPEDRPRVRDAIEAALENGDPFEFETRLRPADTETRWVRVYGAPQRSEGSIVRLQGAVVDITAQKSNEHELRTFRAAVEHAGHAIYWTDPEGVIEYANPAFEETTGYDREAVVGEPSSVLKSGIHTDEFYEEMWETLLEGRTWKSELVNERKSGERYTVNQTISPVRDDDGEIQRYVAVNQDITDRKEQREQLNALFETTRELLRADTREEIATIAVETARDVLGLSIDGVYRYDGDRDALVATATTDAAEGAVDELRLFERGSTAWDVFESGEARIRDGQETSPETYDPETTTTVRSEYYLPLGDHGVFLAGSSEPNAFDDRTVSLAQILAANVETALDRLDREIDLRETSERLRAIIEHTPDALFVLDDDDRIVEANEQAYASLGYEREREELLAMPRTEIGTMRTAEESTPEGDPLAPLRRDPDSVITREGHHVRSDGTEFPVRVKITRIDREDEPRFLAIARDISELERQKQKLRRRNERLEAFAGVVSHDLRNPLTVAKTGVELARRTGDGYGESLDRIENAHDRMEELIEDLLALARNGQPIEEHDLEPLELSDVVARSWGTVSTIGAELRIEDDTTVVADESRLRQFFENLFRNAVEHGSTSSRTQSDDAVEHSSTSDRTQVDDSIKYGSTDSPTRSDEGFEDGHTGDHPGGSVAGEGGESIVTVRVGALPDGFYIEDDGPGIPEPDREAVFEPGYSTQDDGTGFGLEIVRSVADAHGWEVTVTDSAEGGARFEVTDVETKSPE